MWRWMGERTALPAQNGRACVPHFFLLLSREPLVRGKMHDRLEQELFTLRRYTQSADIWAFGIIMLELATGQVPRHGMGFRALVMDTVHGDTPSLGSLTTKHTYSKASSSPALVLTGNRM